MKILHTADLHLGGALKGFSAVQAAELRKKGILTFKRIAQYAKDKGIEHILIAGDFFDTDHPSVQIRDGALSVFNEYSDISFYLISGNHDDRLPLEFLSSLPQNVIHFGEQVSSVALSESVTLWSSSSETPDISQTELDAQRINIVMLHGEPSGTFGRASVDIKAFDGLPVDYLALGHYHSFSCGKCGRGEWVMSGTPMARGFDEAGEKGFVEINIEDKRLSYSFIPLSNPRFFVEQYEMRGEELDYAMIKEFIVAKGIESEDFLRLTLTGTTSTLHIDTDFTAERLRDCCSFITVFDKTGIEQDNFSSVSLFAEFKSLVQADNTLSDEDKNEIIKYGYSALKGEEPDSL